MFQVFTKLGRSAFTIPLDTAKCCSAVCYDFSQFAQSVTALPEAGKDFCQRLLERFLAKWAVCLRFVFAEVV